MDNIYDVFRALVNASRHVLPDAQVAEAHAIIDKTDPAVTAPEVKADA